MPPSLRGRRPPKSEAEPKHQELHSVADFDSMAESMRHTILIWSAVVIAAGIAIGQGPVNQPAGQTKSTAKGQGKAPPRNPAQSPASQPGPQTATPQTYPIAQVQAGEQKFTSQCGFCHGRDAAGGETGPDLTRSDLVAGDVRGDKIGPLLRKGRPDQGMPSFDLSDADLGAIAAFVHDQKTKFEGLGGGVARLTPRTWQPATLPPAAPISTEPAVAPAAIPVRAILPGSLPAIKDWRCCSGCSIPRRAGPLQPGQRRP